MFSFLAVVFSAKWISEHLVFIIIFALLIICLIVYASRRRKRAIQEYQERVRLEAAEKERKAEKERIEAERKAAAEAARIKPFPEALSGLQIEYSYRDVVLVQEGARRNIIRGEELSLVIRDDRVIVKANSIPIGYMKENRLAEMVKDWDKKGDPCKCYFMENTDDGPMIALFFYADVIGKFESRHPDAKMIQLIGKPDDMAFYDIGNKCEVTQDEENEGKFIVLCDDEKIGGFPAAGISYAAEHGCSPEDLDVIIADIEYDIDKDRDIISVYISD